jgi:hypothetical protein
MTITGINLSGAPTVAFNGTTAPITSDSATQIVPDQASAGTVGRRFGSHPGGPHERYGPTTAAPSDTRRVWVRAASGDYAKSLVLSGGRGCFRAG